jgi:GNAT superfamily N-acetyltransferase
MIREAHADDAAAIAHVHVATWRTTYQGIVPESVLANLSEERRAEMWSRAIDDPARAGFVYVAKNATGRVIGFAAGGPERDGDPIYTGELYAIYLLSEHQGSGIGRQLMRHVAMRLIATGHASMLLWVLAENPACRFYAVLGGQPVREKTVEMGGVSLREVAYGWTDIRPLRADRVERAETGERG